MKSIISCFAIVAILFTLMSVGTASRFSSSEFMNLKTYYSYNISNEEYDVIVNVIHVAEKRFTVDQIEEIANFVSKTLSDLWSNAWPVIVLKSSNSLDSFGIFPHSLNNKIAGWTDVGNYRLGYIIYQRTYCLTPSTTFASNSSAPVISFGDPTNSTQIEMIKSAIYNSLFYAGENTYKAANYIFDKLTSTDKRSWNAIVVAATGAVYSSSYFCPEKNLWAFLTSYLDFKYNYYIWAGEP